MPSPKIILRRRTLRSGFTLLELLVTISIIGVLATLVVPAVSKMKKGALATRCVGNLRQIGIGMNSYAASNDGQLPIAWTADNQSWVQRIAPYLQTATGTVTTWVCPDARLKPQTVGTENWLSTYSMHGRLGAEDPALRIRKVGVNRPGEVILVADGVQNPSNKNLAEVTLYYPNEFYSTSTSNPEAFINSTDGHDGGLSYHHPNKTCNVLMLDGSVQSLQQGTVRKKNVVASGG